MVGYLDEVDLDEYYDECAMWDWWHSRFNHHAWIPGGDLPVLFVAPLTEFSWVGDVYVLKPHPMPATEVAERIVGYFEPWLLNKE